MSDFLPSFQNIYTTYKSFFDVFISNTDTTDFKWTPELQQTFDRVKKELTDGTLRLAIANSEKPFYIHCDASNYGIGAALLQKNQFGKMELVSANSRLFSTTELRLSTILRECSAIIYALSEHEFLIHGSKYPIILYTDHKPILFLFTQRNKPKSLQISIITNETSKPTHSLDGRKKPFTSRSTKSHTDDNNTRRAPSSHSRNTRFD